MQELGRLEDVDMEAAYGRRLEWEALPNARACRIADYRDDADVTFENRHDEFVVWLLDAGVRMRKALASVHPSPL